MIFIDTDILIDLTQNPIIYNAELWYESLQEIPKIPAVVASEIILGTRNAKEKKFYNNFLQQFEIILHSPEDQLKALALIDKVHLSNKIGFNDALIAETAKRLGATIHTLNEKHFKCIPDLIYNIPYRKKDSHNEQKVENKLKINVTSISGIEGKENNYCAKLRAHIPLVEISPEKVYSEEYKKELEQKIQSLFILSDLV